MIEAPGLALNKGQYIFSKAPVVSIFNFYLIPLLVKKDNK